MPEKTYTYRCGQKVALEKKPDEFVVRALPKQLQHLGFDDMEQVSSASTRVTTSSTNIEAMMSLSRNMAVTHHAYLLENSDQEFLITDRILVQFASTPSRREAGEFAAQYGLVMRDKFAEDCYLFQLTGHTGMNPCKLIVKLIEEDSRVATAEHDMNFRIRKYDLNVPADPNYEFQWHLHANFNDSEFDPRASSRCEEAWKLLDSFGDRDIVIGVADDGCKTDHPDFGGDWKFAGWGYFEGTRLYKHSDLDAERGKMYKTGADHGTSSAGVAVGNVNASHTVGGAPNCRLLPVKWQSTGPFLAISDSKLLAAINFMADKVDIMSNSWGIIPVVNWWPQVINRIKELTKTGGRRGKGILFMWAAGNDNCPIQHTTHINTPYTIGWNFKNDGSREWVGVRTATAFQNNLVDIPGVMHIAAIASTAKRSHYSNYGHGISVCAPSSNVHTYQRMWLDGIDITTVSGMGRGVTDQFGGTSSACPLTAAVAALALSANPALSALELQSLLQRTAGKALNFEGYDRTPAASYDSNTDWDVSPISPFDDGAFADKGYTDGTWSPWFGFGKVDAHAAVAEALRMKKKEDNAAHPEFFKAAASPNIRIPDNKPSGIVHVIPCDRSGPLHSVRVSVDISHTYIGDIRVALESPSGKEVILQDRIGGSQNDLKKTFTSVEVPGLNQLLGDDIQGNWTLKVADVAEQDTGKLNSWEIELRLDASEMAYVSKPGLKIPDNSPEGIEDTIGVDIQGTLSDLELEIDIAHTYIGDLQVILFAPSGKSVVLHNRLGGNTQNIIKKFSMQNTPDLQILKGEQLHGSWRLKVIDFAQVDTGKLNMWRMRLKS